MFMQFVSCPRLALVFALALAPSLMDLQKLFRESGKCAVGDNTAREQASGETTKGVASSTLFRGEGHTRFCSMCYHTEKYGRHKLCMRMCALVNRSWGPTVCDQDCRKSRNTCMCVRFASSVNELLVII
jgi:hypothetical protein